MINLVIVLYHSALYMIVCYSCPFLNTNHLTGDAAGARREQILYCLRWDSNLYCWVGSRVNPCHHWISPPVIKRGKGPI